MPAMKATPATAQKQSLPTPVERLKPGMSVGTDVRNHDGFLILPAGSILSERHIQMLATWGILEVRIGQGEPETAPLLDEAELQQRIEAARETLRPHFLHCDTEDPLVAELLSLCAERLARQNKPS